MTVPQKQSLHRAFIESLDADRDSFNQRFRLASMHGPTLDRAIFFSHLTHRVEPIVAAVHAMFPERTRSVVSELYDVSLDLFRKGYFGNESRLPALDQLWTQILPAMPYLIARDARKLVGALSNALIYLVAQPSTRVQFWLAEVARIAVDCQSSAELLDATAILVWRCGMAQFRPGALLRLQSLPRQIAMKCLAVEPSTAPKDWEQLLVHLVDNEWFDPQSSADGKTHVGVVQCVSGFRGFGGHMMNPPSVGIHDGYVVVRDEKSAWRLYADCYGWYLHRIGEANEFDMAVRSRTDKVAVCIDESGRVQWDKTQVKFKHLAGAASQAFDGRTLAVTLPTSYHVFLIANAVALKGSS